MVKQSLDIYKRDLKTIFTNYAVLITVIALCILPSLYAWINIKASWDPYASDATSRIKVAVVNNDQGSSLNGKEINLGQEVVDELKKNTLLGWCFLDEETAMRDLKEGKVYANIIIPKDFSESLTSLVTNTIKEAQIRYIVNEKLNAIAPKITDKGATGIQNTVSEKVVSTVSDIVLSIAKDLGVEIGDVVLPKLLEIENALNKAKGQFIETNHFIDRTQQEVENLDQFLNQLIDYMPNVKKILGDVEHTSNSIEDFVHTAQTGVQNLAPTIQKDIVLVKELSEEIYSDVESLENFLKSADEKAPEIAENLLNKVEGLEQLTQSMMALFKGVAPVIQNDAMTNAISQLEDVNSLMSQIKEDLTTFNNSLGQTGGSDFTTLTNIKTLLSDLNNIATTLDENFEANIMDKINGIFNQIDSNIKDGKQVLVDIEGALPEVSNLIQEAQSLAQTGESGLGKIKDIIPTLEDKLVQLTKQIHQVNTNQDLKEFLNLVRTNVQQRTQFLAHSINIKEEVIFPMGNYGSQMTPFYSTLASWVGLTLLVSIISVDKKGEYTSNEIYFGRLLTYITITMIQGLIIALGDLYLLKIYCLRPWLFIMSMLYITITFTIIIYSLVSVFGNIGKVTAIVLMILQVAGSGGTFPVQLTSKFFIAINPFLPFSYAISLLRETIGGVTQSIFLRDIAVLGGIIVMMILISVLLKKYMNRLLGKFVHKFEEGDL
ncbi:MAG: YhgE/Pip domain-containing protein [Cellulosilyticum sp.]|nr:YhgE/Pip domain-containing protein [Cellulosilyticum sp.]